MSIVNFVLAIKDIPKYLNLLSHIMESLHRFISLITDFDARPTATQLDFLQLNSNSKRLLDCSQQVNIDCNPVTEADSKIKSSAYMIAKA